MRVLSWTDQKTSKKLMKWDANFHTYCNSWASLSSRILYP